MYGAQELSHDQDAVDGIISNTLFRKEGFRLRVANYKYIVSGGREGLDAGYPDGFPPYADLCRIFRSVNQTDFRDYVNMIVKRRERIMRQESSPATPQSSVDEQQ